jgi:succinate-semialdehyde dehydrogenase/glutarate-semialdehyde dehydrogenase
LRDLERGRLIVTEKSANRLPARGNRARELRFEKRLFIDGQWRDALGGKSFEVHDPSTQEVLATLPLAECADTTQAIEAATRAFPAWRNRTALERADLLLQIAQRIEEYLEPLAQLVVLEQGQPLAASRSGVGYAASFFRWYAEEARRVYGYSIPAPEPNRRLQVEYFPRGVAGVITPWNAPLASPAKKIAAALAAGCTVVLKPSELTPLSALALVWITAESGIPPGVFNVVCGDAPSIGKALLEHSAVRTISFTGSLRTGRYLYTEAARHIKHVCLELGGNAPFIIFADADLDRAVEDLVKLKKSNSGQICVTANRVCVEASVFDRVQNQLAAKFGSLSMGDGFTESVEQGPLISSDAATRVDALVQEALAAGAKPICGAQKSQLGPNFYPPTILTNTAPQSRLLTDEIFGPVLPLIPFDSEAEVIAAANNTEDRLAAYAYTTNLNRAWRLSRDLDFGVVGLNDPRPLSCEAPFGGVSQSGLGREGGREGIMDFLESRLIGMRM